MGAWGLSKGRLEEVLCRNKVKQEKYSMLVEVQLPPAAGSLKDMSNKKLL